MSCYFKLTVLACVCLFCSFIAMANAEQSKVISANNEFGGETVEVSFSTKEALKEGHNRKINYYGGNGRNVKMEDFFTPELANKKGYSRAIIYYDGNRKMMKIEAFFLPEFSNKEGHKLKNYLL